MKLWKLPLLLLSLLGLAILPADAKNSVDQTVVEAFELQRYLGLWYEIARIENQFEKGLTHVTAEYSLKRDGNIRVVNSGRKSSKNTKIARGKARFAHPDKSPSNGALEVSFFWNFYSPYNVMLLCENYAYALVGSGPDLLWVLSRTKKLSDQTLKEITDEATRRGYDTSRLLFVKH